MLQSMFDCAKDSQITLIAEYVKNIDKKKWQYANKVLN
jgi:hypothetical protein